MLFHLLMVSLFLFSTGLYGFLSRRSAVGILISVELMLNAAAINLVAFNRFMPSEQVDGQILALFIMAVAAAEVLVGMAILVMVFRKRRSVDITSLNELRH